MKHFLRPQLTAVVFLFFWTSGFAQSATTVIMHAVDSSKSQEQPPPPFLVLVDGGAGYSHDIGALPQPTATPGANYSNGGFIGLIRIRGSRSRFIKLGLETGFQHFSSVNQSNAVSQGYGTTGISASLSGIPLLGMVTLSAFGLQLHGGVGLYRLISSSTLFNHTVTSSEWDMTYLLGLSTTIDIGLPWKLLPELRFTRINDQARSLLALLIRLELPEWKL